MFKFFFRRAANGTTKPVLGGPVAETILASIKKEKLESRPEHYWKQLEEKYPQTYEAFQNVVDICGGALTTEVRTHEGVLSFYLMDGDDIHHSFHLIPQGKWKDNSSKDNSSADNVYQQSLTFRWIEYSEEPGLNGLKRPRFKAGASTLAFHSLNQKPNGLRLVSSTQCPGSDPK